jgi:hypothetical protein
VTLGQRIVVVIALGLALATIAQTINHVCFSDAGGWFGYAPGTDVKFFPQSHPARDAWIRAAVWLVALATWCGVSFRLLRAHD